jgi:hypothetical protein
LNKMLCRFEYQRILIKNKNDSCGIIYVH